MDTGLISSRFLEELELGPTQAIASEVVCAANGDWSGLVKICREYSAYHNMVGAIKDVYSNFLPEDCRPGLERVELAPVGRTFTYRQQYDSAQAPTVNSCNESANASDEDDIWGHIEMPSVGRRNAKGDAIDGDRVVHLMADLRTRLACRMTSGTSACGESFVLGGYDTSGVWSVNDAVVRQLRSNGEWQLTGGDASMACGLCQRMQDRKTTVRWQ